MPPVSPTRYARATAPSGMAGEQPEVGADHAATEHHHQPASRGEERAKRNGGRAVLATKGKHGDTHERTDHRGEQDHGQQHLPAEPGAESGKEFEVAVSHTFLAGEQAEEMIDAPQA